MRPQFADPKTDIVFKRIFGDEAHKPILIAFLNDVLGLDAEHRVVDLEYLPAEQVPPLDGLKLSIVDVKCVDAKGTRYIVEMQVLKVDGFEKRLVYNVCKAYSTQLMSGAEYPMLDDVIGVAICDFFLWPERTAGGTFEVPMLTRWRMTEEQSGARRFSQVRLAVLELPKYGAGAEPRTTIDKWAYFFREAERLPEVPAALSAGPYAEALEVARTSRFTPEEWDAYDRAKMAEQDARGALNVAREEGREEGATAATAKAILTVLTARGIAVSDEHRALISGCSDRPTLERWLARAAVAPTAGDLIGS